MSSADGLAGSAGPPVVCLHGGMSRPATWARLRAELEARGYATYAPPLLGHRGAPGSRRYDLTEFRDDVLRRLDAAGLGRCALVGHSLGAYVATMAAQQRPERVAALVLEEPPVPPRDAHDDPPTVRRMTTMRLAGPLRPDRCRPRMLGRVLAQLRTPQPVWWAELDRLSMPTLVVAGGEASHLDQRRLVSLADRVPRGELCRIEAGHRIHSQAPERFTALAVEFLGRAGRPR